MAGLFRFHSIIYCKGPDTGWIDRSRLDHLSKMIASIPDDDAEKWSVLGRLRENGPAAVKNLRRLHATI